MRLFSFCIFFLVVTGMSSQGDSVVISGRVLADGTNEPVVNAILKLNFIDGGLKETLSDKRGEYTFTVPRKNNSASLSVIADKKTSTADKRNYFFSSKETVNLNLLSPVNFKKDFYLTKMIICHRIPEAQFKHNSAKLTEDTAIVFLVGIMKDNPGIVIQIDAHTSFNETAPEQLSLQRAKSVKTELLKQNIHPLRIECKGYGAKNALIPVSMINRAKLKGEKETLHQKNRRATFKILRFDFEEKEIQTDSLKKKKSK